MARQLMTSQTQRLLHKGLASQLNEDELQACDTDIAASGLDRQ